MGSPLRDLNILVTGAGAPGFPGITKSLRRNGERSVKIIGTDMKGDVVGFHLADKHYIVPSGLDQTYIDAIIEIIQEENIEIILPLCTFELLPLSKSRKEIEDYGAKVAVSKPKALEKAIDKAKTYEFIKGDFIPEYKVANDFEAFKNAVHELGYPKKPVVFKPSFGRGMRGFRIIKDNVKKKDLLFNYKPRSTFIRMTEISEILKGGNFPQLVVMEYLPGEEYSVDTLSKDGQIYYSIARKRIETRRGISYVGRIEKNEELEEASQEIVRQLGLDYSINIQFKATESGEHKLIEINPRVSGSLVFCVEAGVNLPYFTVKLLLEEEIPKVEVRYGTRIYRYWSEVVVSET
jgi:carbamoyl-phosphate synthase large subunit